MNRLPILFLFAHAVVAGCAGELTDQEKEKFLRGSGAGGSAGGETGGSGPGPTGTGTGGATSGGTGGATTGVGGATTGTGGGGPVDLCVVPIMRDKCATAGCHGPPQAVADLSLTEAVLSQPSSLVDKPNVGQQSACSAGAAKLIDSAQPEKSLIYTKVSIPTCGSKMPVGTPLNPTEIACVLSWIKSAGPGGGGTGGAGGATGTGGAGGTGGTGGTGGARDAGRG